MSDFTRAARVLVTALTLTVVSTLAACSGDLDQPPAGQGPAGSQGTQDVPASPQQPFDVLKGDKLGLIEFAELKLRNTCLKEAGYPQNLDNMPAKPGNPIAYLWVSAGTFGPVSEEEAQQNGFGSPAAPEPPVIVSFDASYDREMERCTGVARDRLGFDESSLMNAYLDLATQLGAFRAEVTTALPSDLPERLWQCMHSKGFDADHQRFLSTPNPTMFGVAFGELDPSPADNWRPAKKTGTVQVGPAVPARKYHPTAEESKLAVAWFQCSQQTRRVELELQAAYAAQQRYLDRFEGTVTELNARVEDAARKASTAAGI